MVSVRAWLKSFTGNGLQGDGIFRAVIPPCRLIPLQVPSFLLVLPVSHDTLLNVPSPKKLSPARLFVGFLLGAEGERRPFGLILWLTT